jgi:hypothetical protein
MRREILTKFWCGNLKERHLKYLGLDGGDNIKIDIKQGVKSSAF